MWLRSVECVRIKNYTLGKDIELGLANAIKLIADHQRESNPNFKTETFLEALRSWIKCLE